MWIECNGCPVRGSHCDDCMVTGLLAIPVGPLRPPGYAVPDPVGEPGAFVELDQSERIAVSWLAGAGLVSPDEAANARAQVWPGSPVQSLPQEPGWRVSPVDSATG